MPKTKNIKTVIQGYQSMRELIDGEQLEKVLVLLWYEFALVVFEYHAPFDRFAKEDETYVRS